MIKLLLLVLAGFVVYSLISSLLRPRPPRPPRNRSREGEVMVQDPQCGTYLPEGDAISATVNGKSLHFCSQNCLKSYRSTH